MIMARKIKSTGNPPSAATSLFKPTNHSGPIDLLHLLVKPRLDSRNDDVRLDSQSNKPKAVDHKEKYA